MDKNKAIGEVYGKLGIRFSETPDHVTIKDKTKGIDGHAKRISVDMDAMHDAVIKLLTGEVESADKLSNLLNMAYRQAKIDRYRGNNQTEKLIDSENTLAAILTDDSLADTINGISADDAGSKWLVEHIEAGLRGMDYKRLRTNEKTIMAVWRGYYLNGQTLHEIAAGLGTNHMRVKRIVDTIRQAIEKMRLAGLYTDQSFAGSAPVGSQARIGNGRDQYQPLESRFPELAKPGAAESIDPDDYTPQRRTLSDAARRSALHQTAHYASSRVGRPVPAGYRVATKPGPVRVLMGYDVQNYSYGLRPEPVWLTIAGQTSYGSGMAIDVSR